MVVSAKPFEMPRNTTDPVNTGAGGPRCNKIFVGGLSGDTTDAMFREYFAQYGSIVESQIMQDHQTKRSRGFGFVTYDDPDAVDAVFVNGSMQEVNGKVVELKRAVPKNQITPPSRLRYEAAQQQRQHGAGGLPQGGAGGFPGAPARYGDFHGGMAGPNSQAPPGGMPPFDPYGYAAARASGWSGGAGWGWGAMNAAGGTPPFGYGVSPPGGGGPYVGGPPLPGAPPPTGPAPGYGGVPPPQSGYGGGWNGGMPYAGAPPYGGW